MTLCTVVIGNVAVLTLLMTCRRRAFANRCMAEDVDDEKTPFLAERRSIYSRMSASAASSDLRYRCCA